MLHSRISLQTAVRSVLQSYKSLEFLGTSEQGQLTLIGALKGPQAGISMCVFSDIGELDPNVRDFHTFRLKRDNVHKLVTELQNGTLFEYKEITNHLTTFAFNNGELHVRHPYSHLPAGTAWLETSYSISLSKDILKVLAHNSGWSWNYKCPCGSLLPFNSCCYRYQPDYPLNAQQQIKILDYLLNNDSIARHDFPDTPSELTGLKHLIDSPHIGIRHSLITAHMDPDVMQLADFWGDLGHELGVNQYFDESISCFDKAIELDPDLHVAKLEKSVSLGSLGKHEQALKLIDSIPETTDRYEVIKANILNDCENYLEAIPLYEMAIARNPNFFLPYINLISILEDLSHPSLEFWINNAVRLNREHPVIAHKFAKYMFESNRFEELVLCEWIDQVRPVEEESVINRPSYDFEAQACKAYKATAQALLERDDESFDNLANILSNIVDSRFELCGLGKTAMEAATQYGFPNVVSSFHSFICEDCKNTEEFKNTFSSLDFGKYLAQFSSCYHKMEYPECVKIYETCLTRLPDVSSYNWPMHFYAFALDEIGRTHDAINTYKNLYQLDPNEESNVFNIGLLSLNSAQFGQSKYFFEICSREHNNLDAKARLVLLHILHREYDQARIAMNDTVSALAIANNIEASELMADSNPFEELLDYAQINDASETFTKDILREADTFMSLSKISLSDSIRLTENYCSPNEELYARNFLRILEQNRDYSIFYASLTESVSNIDSLPRGSQVSILEAERLLTSQSNLLDHSSIVMAFAKGTEIALRELIFIPYKSMVSNNKSLTEEVVASRGKINTQATGLFKFLDKTDFIELGAMSMTCKLANGRTATKERLIGALRDFIVEQLGLSSLLTDHVLNSLSEVVGYLRNPAVHSEIMNQDDAQRCKTLCIEVINALGK